MPRKTARHAQQPAPLTARWRRRAGARPDEILDAALTTFLDKGFDAARMEDIAARAGLSKAGVYLYFDSKVAVLNALIDREMMPLARRIEALMRAGHADPVQTLRTLATFARVLIADGKIFAVPRLVISIAGRFPEIAAHYRAEVVERALGALTGLIRAGIAQGVFRDTDPALAARIFAGPVIFEALWHHVLRGPLMAPDAAATAADHLDLALNGLIKEDAP